MTVQRSKVVQIEKHERQEHGVPVPDHFGYAAGIAAKLTNEAYMGSFSQKWYVLVFYVINLLMVSADLAIYFRNKKLCAESGNERETPLERAKEHEGK